MAFKMRPNDYGKVLALAFDDDPWLNLLFQNNTIRKIDFFSFLAELIPLQGGLVLTQKNETDVLAVACVEQANTTRASLKDKTKAFIKSLVYVFSLPSRERKLLNRYMRISTSARPKEAHHYLVCIGVSHLYKGQGLGRNMLEQIHHLVDQDEYSTGIGLDTENPANIALYEHFGYRLIQTQQIDELTIYSMFRPRKKQIQ